MIYFSLKYTVKSWVKTQSDAVLVAIAVFYVHHAHIFILWHIFAYILHCFLEIDEYFQSLGMPRQAFSLRYFALTRFRKILINCIQCHICSSAHYFVYYLLFFMCVPYSSIFSYFKASNCSQDQTVVE